MQYFKRPHGVGQGYGTSGGRSYDCSVSSRATCVPTAQVDGSGCKYGCIGNLECCHRSGSTTFLRFSAAFISGALRSSPLAAAVCFAQYSQDRLEPVEGIPEGESTTVDGRPIAVEEEANADNLRRRYGIGQRLMQRIGRCGLNFWLTHPLEDLMRQRPILELMRHYSVYSEKHFRCPLWNSSNSK